jgi:hypothetical protein
MQSWPLKNTLCGVFSGFRPSPRGMGVGKPATTCRAIDTEGGAMLKCDALRAWSVSRLNPYGKCRLRRKHWIRLHLPLDPA